MNKPQSQPTAYAHESDTFKNRFVDIGWTTLHQAQSFNEIAQDCLQQWDIKGAMKWLQVQKRWLERNTALYKEQLVDRLDEIEDITKQTNNKLIDVNYSWK